MTAIPCDREGKPVTATVTHLPARTPQAAPSPSLLPAARLLAWSLVAELDDKPPQDKNRRDWCYCPGCVLVPFRRIA